MTKYEFHLIRSIGTLPNLTLIAQFDDGTIKTYDVKQLLVRYPQFSALNENNLFSKVTVDVGGYGVIWNEELDLSSNEIWASGRSIISPFDNLMSFSDACRIWNLNESTLRKALSYGKLIAGRDCCKYGKQWIISAQAMLREYGKPGTEYTTEEDSYSWDNAIAAEKSVEYRAR